jgi:predicted nucleic acid-binding protein
VTLVYLDTSVVLAHLRAEDVTPPASLWGESLISSRLLQYETLSRLNAQVRGASHTEGARELLGRVAIIELVQAVASRASEPFPFSVRTLDALHLASMLFLVEQGVTLRLASYDRRLTAAAEAMGIGLYPLQGELRRS